MALHSHVTHADLGPRPAHAASGNFWRTVRPLCAQFPTLRPLSAHDDSAHITCKRCRALIARGLGGK